MSIGVYAFVTPDWKELDYPLDLWLTHHIKAMDQVALVTYGAVYLPTGGHPKLKLRSIDPNPMHGRYWSFYTIGKTEAQHLLDTDWKILLDIDEFLYRPFTGGLYPQYVYPLNYHNLFGSLEYEMAPSTPFPPRQFRIHYGNREVLGDGANLAGPWAEAPAFDVWHTGACRNPVALSEKWKAQINREMAMGYRAHEGRLKYLDGAFPYERYPEIWSEAKLVTSNLYSIPDILLANKDRFNWWKP